MAESKKLRFTVHHKGRSYPAGMSASEIGDVAGEFGDHVWEGAKPREIAGILLGSRPVPHPSGLPGGPADDPALPGSGSDAGEATGDDAETNAGGPGQEKNDGAAGAAEGTASNTDGDNSGASNTTTRTARSKSTRA